MLVAHNDIQAATHLNRGFLPVEIFCTQHIILVLLEQANLPSCSAADRAMHRHRSDGEQAEQHTGAH
jgi:hypothetical protein